MRFALRFCLAALSVPLLSACSIHPVPKDVTGVDTYAIVMRVRCEARLAVMRAARNYLAYKLEESQNAGYEDLALARLVPEIDANIERIVDERN